MPVAAAPKTFSPTAYISVYKIYLRGILFARADVELAVTNRQYKLSALLRPSGLGVAFSDASGLVKTTGKLHGDNLEPVSLHYSWTGKDSINFARLNYADGAPVSYETNYKSERSLKAMVQIRMENVGSGTRDPFLSMLVRQRPERGDAFCRTPMRLYDGRRLARLNPEDMESAPIVAAPGHIACRVRWEPIAGYPEKTYQRAEKMHPVKLEFAGIANSGFMAPREVSVSTRYGTVRIVAVEPFHESNTQVVPEKLELSPRIDDDEEEED